MAETLPKNRRSIATVMFLLGLLTAETVLFASEQFQWFAFNYQKGMTVLLTVVLVGIAMLAYFAAMGIGRLFKRRAQFGLGTVFVLVVLAALPCAWLATERQQARRQAALVQRIEADGGGVTYNGWDPHWCRVWLSFDDAKQRKTREETLESVLGVDFFFDVKVVALNTPTLADQLHHFPHLKVLRMDLETTDWDIDKLTGLKELESIDLTATRISDHCLMRLAAMPALKDIYLSDTEITDAGIEHLHEMPCLSFIDIENTGVTDAGVDSLRKRFPDTLVYSGTNVSQ